MFEAQMAERRDLTNRIDTCRRSQRAERLQTVGQIAYLLKLERWETIGEREPYQAREISPRPR